MSRDLADARRWTEHATQLFTRGLGRLDVPDFAGPSGLPGWNRKHLIAHVCANADAIGNLIHWAATGVTTPMYASPEQRNADIEAGSQLSAPDLTEWFQRSASALAAAMDTLTAEQWQTEVVTAQGRTVPATETPWMRAREVMVHTVDLDAGVTFADLPNDFLRALVDDIVAKRNATGNGPAVSVATTDGERWELTGSGAPVVVSATLPAIASYLAGRGADGVPGPALPPWL